MKAVYRADAVNRTFTSSDVVADDYQLKDNETFEDPSGKLSPAKLTATGGPWIDATEEENQAYLEAQQKKSLAENPQFTQPSQPADDKGGEALNLLGQQIAQMQVQQNNMAKSINALGQMVAAKTSDKAQA